MKKPTITLAVSAYNKENNIAKFLKSVLAQKEKNFKLEKILIVSDGSTDKTVDKIKKMKSPFIEIIQHDKRLGKSSRLNEIYSGLKSDFLIQSDSDVLFAHSLVISKLIKPLIDIKKVGMCGGNPSPMTAETFTERAVNYTTQVFHKFRKTVKGGNNIFSADGRLLAFKKEVIKKINIPNDMIANDAFAYFSTLILGYQYKFVKEASVYYRSPQSLKDQITQNTRFLAAPKRMTYYFPKELVKKEWQIPLNLLIKELFFQFLKHPIETLYIYTINRYCQIRAYLIERHLNAHWDIAHSTKILKSKYA